MTVMGHPQHDLLMLQRRSKRGLTSAMTTRSPAKPTPPLLRMVLMLCALSAFVGLLQLSITSNTEIPLRNIRGGVSRQWSVAPCASPARPVRHLVYLKNHKCASSTVQTLVLRRALRQNLTVALPLTGVYLDYGVSPNPQFVRDVTSTPFAPPGGVFQVLAHHMRLHVRHLQQVTFEDATWITILREPASLFESMYNYYQMQTFYHVSFTRFLQGLYRWLLPGQDKLDLRNVRKSRKRMTGRYGRNQMLWDLGINDGDLDDSQVVTETIKTLDDTFHLVLIAEYMDESLILLKHLLCWTTEDMLVLPLNVRQDRYRSKPLSESDSHLLRLLNEADVRLYQHFLKKFKRQIEVFGEERMKEEVAELRDLRDQLREECGVTSISEEKRRLDTPRSRGVIRYLISGNTTRTSLSCDDLIRTGRELTDELRKRQFQRYHRYKAGKGDFKGGGGGGGGRGGGSGKRGKREEPTEEVEAKVETDSWDKWGATVVEKYKNLKQNSNKKRPVRLGVARKKLPYKVR
ncbi:galactosylceramide sulfotransferase-like isoform X2 [Oratosquilla oratoria]|uniref:galactosylceramide sulfotransferase-like n=1 Tax=Oratosquilla oratoria TaxID=337810 RepID=UPI003F7647A3